MVRARDRDRKLQVSSRPMPRLERAERSRERGEKESREAERESVGNLVSGKGEG